MRGVPAELRLDATSINRIRLRQPRPADVEIEPGQANGALRATLVARRRGRHVLPAPASRVTGPLGLGAWTHRSGEPAELVVYPDLPGARRLAASVRRGRLRDEGRINDEVLRQLENELDLSYTRLNAGTRMHGE